MFDGQVQEDKFQFVLPKSYWKQLLEACHDNMGHLGIERTTCLLRDWFYWPSMIEDIEHHIKSCPRCLRFETQPEKAELNPIIVTRPLELVHIDFLTVKPQARYHSKRLLKSAKNFGVTELELTGLLVNIHGFMQLLCNRYFEVLVDHKAIEYMIKSKTESPMTRLKTLLLKLSEYTIELKYQKGSEMHTSDALSMS